MTGCDSTGLGKNLCSWQLSWNIKSFSRIWKALTEKTAPKRWFLILFWIWSNQKWGDLKQVCKIEICAKIWNQCPGSVFSRELFKFSRSCKFFMIPVKNKSSFRALCCHVLSCCDKKWVSAFDNQKKRLKQIYLNTNKIFKSMLVKVAFEQVSFLTYLLFPSSFREWKWKIYYMCSPK